MNLKKKRSKCKSQRCSSHREESCFFDPSLLIPTAIPGPPGPPGPPGASSDSAFIYNLSAQALTPETDILFDSNGPITSAFTHTPGAAEILINVPGDYYISFSVSGDITNQFALFNGGVLVPGTIYGSDDANQQNTGQVVLTVDTVPATLTVRYHTNVVPLTVTLQTPAGGTQANDTASVFIQKLGVQTTVTVATSADLIAALNNNAISRIILTPGTYDISASSAVVRTNAVRLISTAATTVIFNTNQEFDFITIGENIDPQAIRIRNITQGINYPDIQTAINAANPGDVIELSPGTYTAAITLATPLTINKALTLRGISAQLTEVNFSITGSQDFAYLVIAADNVTVENIHFIGPTGAGLGSNALFTVALRSFLPFLQYTNDIIRYNILEGGRRGSFLDVANFQYIGNTIIHTGDRDAVVLQSSTNSLFYGNIFNGGAASRRTFSLEASSGSAFLAGGLQLSNNTIFSWSQPFLFNHVPIALTFLITENYVNHQARSGSTVIFFVTGANTFAGFTQILIQDNTFINPNATRLAVYLDYTGGGTSVPSNGEIQVYSNFFRYVGPPYGNGTDITVTQTIPPPPTPMPIGYTSIPPSPPTITPAVFDVQGNIIF